MSLTLERIGFALGRLKTGTPPRLDGTTIDWSWSRCSRATSRRAVLDAHRAHRDAADPVRHHAHAADTHDIIRANVHRSPMYSGQIASRGPRYCPSIEDKIVRFGERDGHQILPRA
jgi:tRNA uridine 5-carboxymethylaminomethyl modification enzyme